MKLWASGADLERKEDSKFIRIIYKYIKKLYQLDGLRLSDEMLKKYVNEINRVNPKIILAYVQSIFELAKFIERNNLEVSKIKSIITSAAMLTDDVKNYIESIFHCDVYNRYGSREVGLIASSCEESNKLHINMLQKYVEILDDKNNPVPENKRGNIIITNLINYYMPLIRYKIGDLGSLNFSLEKCGCDMHLLQLDNVFGRITDIFKTSTGKKIYGGFFTHLFYFRENVKQFQVIQENMDEILVKIVTLNGKHLQHSNEKDLIKKMRRTLGEELNIKVEYVDLIEPSPSGKFRYTISHLN